jgi:hypothetical protein
MGILKSADARRRTRRPRVGSFLPLGLRRHMAVEHKRQLRAWPDTVLPLLVLEAPPARADVRFHAVLDPHDRETLSQRLTTYVTEALATRLDITVLRVADGNYEDLINSRAAKHTATARLAAEGAARGDFTDRTPRLPPDPQPWASTPIVIDGAEQAGRWQSLSSAEWLAYAQYEGALIELHAYSIDLADARMRREEATPRQLAG